MLLTGIGIFERSLPIQFFKMFQRLKLCVGLGGMVVLRDFFIIVFSGSSGSYDK